MSKQRNGRRKMLLVALLCAAPIVAAYLAYFFWQPQQHTNYGDLLPVRQLPEGRLELLEGKPFRFASLKGKWIMVSIDSGDCNAACQNKLLIMRQLRLMQGADMDRLERVFLITDELPLTTLLIREFDGTHIARVRDGRFADYFPAADSPDKHIYLVDPYGNLMLRFPVNPDPARMKKDLQQLLKAQGSG
jgi:cytochrome oxidase Cu insertion factor (SCO1/SenC/PrrC family)